MKSLKNRSSIAGWGNLIAGLTLCGMLGFGCAGVATATELSGSVYPAGAETVMTGTAPAPGGTLFLNFENFYFANGLVDSKGHSVMPGFHLRVGASAVKIVHNWGVNVLGGTLVSAAALPMVYEHLDGPMGVANKTGFSNPDLQVAAVSYGKGLWRWWYGFDVYTPGFSYNKNDLVNIGQHNFAYAPEAAFTFLPHNGSLEISSKLQYIVNGENSAMSYTSGREFLWEYGGMKKVARGLTIGWDGYWYQQTSNDMQNGLIVGDGNRGRDFTFGPQVKYHAGPFALIAKYQKDSLVENRPTGHSLWFEFGVPLSRGHE
ncbi:MAG: transporter [Bryobacteraceae bacterium]|jgi:hypothetical protein